MEHHQVIVKCVQFEKEKEIHNEPYLPPADSVVSFYHNVNSILCFYSEI